LRFNVNRCFQNGQLKTGGNLFQWTLTAMSARTPVRANCDLV
jgi:hypothetical protein